MKKPRITSLLLLAFISIVVFIIACVKEASVHKAFNTLGEADSRDVYELSIDEINITGNDGQCYYVTIHNMSDGSAIIDRDVVPCIDGYSTRTGVYINAPYQRETESKIAFTENCWYIPLSGEASQIPGGGGSIECFCERVVAEDPVTGGPCPGGPTCDLDPRAWSLYYCEPEPCCEDCDIRLCVVTYNISGVNGLIIKANSVILQ